ncbi:MAG: hypothetical protein JWM99_4294 [Verrucomicrobiales bacterium]|nr:hypothetical protein [Verrucomicrobiales bacterium]
MCLTGRVELVRVNHASQEFSTRVGDLAVNIDEAYVFSIRKPRDSAVHLADPDNLFRRRSIFYLLRKDLFMQFKLLPF